MRSTAAVSGGVLLVAFVVSCLTSAPGVRAGVEEPGPRVKDVLAKVDAALFFPDAQEGLARYACTVSETNSAKQVGGVMVPDLDSATRIARVAVDREAGTKVWKKADGKTIDPGTWTPSCGPWTLTAVVRFEVELFSSPLSARFNDDDFARTVVEEGEGWRLGLTPKRRLGTEEPFFLRPVISKIDLSVGKDGVPTKATVRLDQGPMQETGTLEFEFAEQGKLRRIAKIKNTIASANLKIHPTLEFTYAPQGGLQLLERIVFRVALGELSPTMGRVVGGDSVSGLIFDEFEVAAAGPPETPKKPGAKGR